MRFATLAVLVCGASSQFGCSAAPSKDARVLRRTDQLPLRIPKQLNVALSQYGWALPVCFTSSRAAKRKSFCVSTGTLLRTFPLQAGEISLAIARKVYDAMPSPRPGRSSLEIVEELNARGIELDCVFSGKTRTRSSFVGVASVGSAFKMPNGVSWTDLCDQDNSGGLIGTLVGEYPRARAQRLAWENNASYSKYYDECMAMEPFRSRQRQISDGGGGNGSGSSTETEDEKKKREAAAEAEKKAEDAKKKAQDAQKAAEDAAKAAEDARKKAAEAQAQAQQVWSDPNSSTADKNSAAQVMLTAAADAAAAQAAADKANANAQAAQAAADSAEEASRVASADYYDSSVDAEYGKMVDEIVDDFGTELTWGWDDGLKAGARFMGAWWGTYGPGGSRDCMQDMGCGLSCEQQARVRALRDELNRGSECNTDVLPIPDSIDHCYGSLELAPQPALVTLLEWSCQQRRKVGVEVCPGPITKGSWSFDPCQGPLVMCAPDYISTSVVRPGGARTRGGIGIGHEAPLSGPIQSGLHSIPLTSARLPDGASTTSTVNTIGSPLPSGTALEPGFPGDGPYLGTTPQ